METKHEDSWVTDQMAAAAPEWQPDVARAEVKLRTVLRTPAVRVSPWAIAATAAAALVVAAAIPQTRAMAQDLWAHFMLDRVDVVRLDFSKLPLDTHVSSNGILSEEAKDVDEAERLAGFRPHLPAGAWGAPAKVSLIAPLSIGQTIHVRQIEAALARMHAADVPVAPEWDGVTLRADVGATIGLEYSGGVEILQTKPISMTIPAGFPLERFAEVAFRSAGASEREALNMARKFAANPAWLLDVSPDEVVNVQELSLAAGPALLVEDYDARGQVEKAAVIRSNRDRIYLVSSPKRELSVRIAEALPADPR